MAMAVAKLLPGLVLALVLHLAAMGLAGVLVGGKLKQASLGGGPLIRRLHVRGVEVILRLLPFYGHVQFWRSDDEPRAPQGTPLFDELPGTRRAAAQLAGPFTLLAAGSLLAARWMGRPALDGAVDLFRGALSPTSTGADLVAEAATAARSLSFHALFAVILAKVAGWNLLPLPHLNGGAALLDLVVPRGERGNRARAIAAIPGVLLMLACAVAWLVALVTFLRR